MPPTVFCSGLLAGHVLGLGLAGAFSPYVVASAQALGAELSEDVGNDQLSALVNDASSFVGGDQFTGLLEQVWAAIHSSVNAAFIPRQSGKIITIAPDPEAGAGAIALRAGLENLSRTLSIEWARYNVRPVTILPGAETDADEVANLVTYLISPAGDYFSGCKFEFGLAE